MTPEDAASIAAASGYRHASNSPARRFIVLRTNISLHQCVAGSLQSLGTTLLRQCGNDQTAARAGAASRMFGGSAAHAGHQRAQDEIFAVLLARVLISDKLKSYAAAKRELLADDGFVFPVESVVFLTILHRLMITGCDRACLRPDTACQDCGNA
jgi:hypothetical protein